MAASNEQRIEKLLALLLINQMGTRPIAEKASRLSVAGFSNVEIADLLETSAGVIAQSLYSARKNGKKKPKKA